MYCGILKYFHLNLELNVEVNAIFLKLSMVQRAYNPGVIRSLNLILGLSPLNI